MTPLDFLKPDIRVRGLVPNQIVTLVSVTQRGSHAVRVIFSLPDGKLQDQMLYHEDEARLELVDDTRRWAFDGDGAMLRLLSEAYRIRLAHLFDPLLAVHTSLIEPLPHQITAVYEDMLNRQPLRFLLADDPGAGKTIMAGLLIRELIVRGDVSRCMICAPGSLTQQWQDEMHDKFQLDFAILSREMIESAHQGDPFGRNDLLIVRLDQVARDPDLRDRLRRSEWDLIVCDEAHKMSASYSGGEKSETKRYQLGKLLGEITRHFLLMTATPHNGKEEDFHLFMALLDADRFEGRPRAGAPPVDVGDVMRRMVKERLLRFDGRRLFPERIAQTINYTLSHDEAELYEAVTGYVRQEFNRADKLAGDGRKNTVGFALTVLQRRLASSPEAIYQSLRRRRERLEVRVRAAQQELRDLLSDETVVWDEPDWDELEAEMELNTATSELVDKASASQTIAELQAEIAHLRALEAQAGRLRSSKTDRKWIELKNLLHILLPPRSEGSDASTRAAHKLVIFTEHLDTLRYLETGLKTLIGRPDAVVSIHGGVDREARHAIQEAFRNDPEVTILLATDAAGEGINLQRAHLMVNYDLPWNPNRLEQRFGRIHRIGQTEVCQLYNLVAGETREGEVFQHLLRKLERERDALDGQVFDVLGKLFQQTPLRDLLVEAIRYGDDPDTRARLEQQLDHVMDIDRVRDLLERGALAGTRMDTSQVTRIRESMERAAARRLQPHYIKTFFLEAFAHLKGTVYERENGRYAIQNVPAEIRTWAKAHGLGTLPRSYERICFEKTLIQPRASGDRSLPAAAFVCPGHPLLDAVIGMILEQESPLLQQGAILIDDTDPGTQPRVLYYLDQRIEDGVMTANGERHIVSREVHFVEIAADGSVREAGGAPYLDYRPATAGEKAALHSLIGGQDESYAITPAQTSEHAEAYAIDRLLPRHLERVRAARVEQIDRIEAAVQDRLTREINYWDARATTLREAERAGRPSARLNSQNADRRANALDERLKERKAELARARQITAAPPLIIGGALIVPIGLLPGEYSPPELLDRRIMETIAMRAVINVEIALGHHPIDVSAHNVGYDIESRDGSTGAMRFIEVKGRRADAETITVTRNEILTALNAPDRFILAIVTVAAGRASPPRYIRQPFGKEPDFNVTSVNYNMGDLLDMSEEPR